jgi:hypothetical protein
MDTLITLEGTALKHLLEDIDALTKFGGARKLTIGIDNDEVKFKIDNFMWSQGYDEVAGATLAYPS